MLIVAQGPNATPVYKKQQTWFFFPFICMLFSALHLSLEEVKAFSP